MRNTRLLVSMCLCLFGEGMVVLYDLSSMWCLLENHEIAVVVVKGIIFEGCVIMESCVKF